MHVPSVLLVVLLLVLQACEPFANSENFTQEPVLVFKRSTLVPPKDPGSPAQLRVMAWNVKYGAGRIPFWFDCWGDRVSMSKTEVEANMAGIYGLLNEVQPDILMTEEIELNSRRSAYYDMIRGVLEHTDLNYAAYFETWNSAYIPSEGLGRINLGNAIFSKYPIVVAERIRQADRTDQDALTAEFYIHRAIGHVVIELPQKTRIAAYVVHTEAYDNDGTKQKQIQQIFDLLKAETLPFLMGGDLNELPVTAVKLQHFPDERATAICAPDFTQPPYTPQVMQKWYDSFQNFISLERYGKTEAEQKRYYSHSILGPDDTNDAGQHGFWNRTLDYLWIRQADAWLPGSTDVIQQKGQKLGEDAAKSIEGLGPVIQSDVLRLSDHAPVTGIWQVKP